MFIEDELLGGSYIIVGTKYGYHVMLFSELINADVNYATLTEYLNHLTGEAKDDAGWTETLSDIVADWDDYQDTDFYLYTLLNLCSGADNALSQKERTIVETYRYNENYVKIHKSTISDLIK